MRRGPVHPALTIRRTIGLTLPYSDKRHKKKRKGKLVEVEMVGDLFVGHGIGKESSGRQDMRFTNEFFPRKARAAYKAYSTFLRHQMDRIVGRK